MKKRILLTALAVISLSSCSKNESSNDGAELVPVRLGNSVVASKAPVATGDFYTAQVIASVTKGDYTTVYIDSKSTSFNLPASFVADNSGAFDDEKVVYYPADGSSIYIRGFYPATGTLSNTIVTYNITGQEDIMISAEQTASKATAAVALPFNHLLSKLSFKIKGDDAAIATWGNVTKVEVLAQTSKLDMNLNETTLANVLKANSAPTPAVFTAYSNATGQALTTTAADLGTTPVGSPVMVMPSVAAWKLKVYTTQNTAGIEISSSEALAINAARAITLTFGATSVTLSATVVNWTDGTPVDLEVK